MMKALKMGLFAGSLLAGVFFLSGCGGEEARTYTRGFRLPEGDLKVGKATFIDLQCTRCHLVDGVVLPDNDLPALPKIGLGGEISRVKSYGELVTSIVSPQHVVSPKYLAILSEEEREGEVESPMPVYHDEMTVRQLIDLVAFLHSRYQLIEPESDDYYYLMP